MMDEKDKIIAAQAARIAELEALILAKDAIIAKLEQRLAELERRLGLNSSNSSKPPSTDGLSKRTLPLRHKSNKPSGGQKGHPGTTLMQTANPDHVQNHGVAACEACGADLASTAPTAIIKRQVHDIPPVSVVVTEHQAEVKICTCGHTTTAPFPPSAKAPTQYGDYVKSLIVYLSVQQMIPEDRLQQTLEDTYGLHISTQTIANILLDAANTMTPHQEKIMEHIKQSVVKHVDESGLRVAGKTQWVHTYGTPDATVYAVSEKRKRVVEGMQGFLVHDHFKSYFTWEGLEGHALCNAHHLRELKAIHEIDGELWAGKMINLLCSMCKRALQETKLHIPWLKRYYDLLLAEGQRYHRKLPPLPGRQKRPGHNLLLRLQAFKEETLRFLDHPDVPFTNNLAEQDIRMVKVRQKISGCFRTNRGAEKFLTIRGFISTQRKRKQNILSAIRDVLAPA